MPWSQYKGRSVGKVIQYIYRYAGLRIAERVMIGDGEVTYGGKPFATYIWTKGDIPHFTFVKEYNFLAKVQEDKQGIEEYVLHLSKSRPSQLSDHEAST